MNTCIKCGQQKPVDAFHWHVIVQNPTVRKIAGNTLAVAALILSIATLVDGAIPAPDYAFVTGPAAIIVTGLLGIFQLSITSPNVPTGRHSA